MNEKGGAAWGRKVEKEKGSRKVGTKKIVRFATGLLGNGVKRGQILTRHGGFGFEDGIVSPR